MSLILSRRRALAAGALLPAAAAAPRRARGQAPAIRLGVLSDMSGPYSDNTGHGSVVGARLAIEDFAKAHPGIRVELISADNQNKADVGMSIARSWYDREGVDCILDVPLSALALAMGEMVREKNRSRVHRPAASDRTGRAAAEPYPLDLRHLGAGAWTGTRWWPRAATPVLPDPTMPSAMRWNATRRFVTAAGGGCWFARYPFRHHGFSSFLLQAQASGPRCWGWPMRARTPSTPSSNPPSSG